VNAEKIKCMLMSHNQKTGQKHSIKIVKRPFENVANFKYLGRTIIDQNCIHDRLRAD
jgi:hypothetical protein